MTMEMPQVDTSGRNTSPGSWPTVIGGMLTAFIVVFLMIEGLLNLTPPVSRDALIHHLAIPKLWLAEGGFVEIPWADFSYYPMTINLLYLPVVYGNVDIAAKFIHMSFGLGIGLLVLFYLKRNLGLLWGLLGAAIFLTTPIVQWLATSAYIDLGMTFFTTGSLIAFLYWRDSGYERLGWLLLSAACMGIAVGSKYNALIAWLVLSLLLVLLYVRDTQAQGAGLGYGLLFVLVVALVASPWYVKNFILTGNPFYPLFQRMFDVAQQNSLPAAIQTQAMEESRKISFFEMRRILYGESFIETLLIPLRMFFQGKDNSYQYFQGVLNPILILFLPFVFLDRRLRRDAVFLISFSALYMAIAYFLTQKQVRYLLPVLPFLSITATIGIHHLVYRLTISTRSPWTRYAVVAVCLSVAALLSLNAVYLVRHFRYVDPIPIVSGRETRDAYLRRQLPHYEAVLYVNRHLPKDASLFTMFLGRRGYYLERSYRNEPQFGRATLGRLVRAANTPEAFSRAVSNIGVTHLLVRKDLFDRYLRDNYSAEKIRRLHGRIQKSWDLVYNANGYVIWQVAGKGTPEGSRRKKGIT